MLPAGANSLDTFFRLVETILRAIVIRIDLQRLRERNRRRIVLGQLRVRNSEVVVNVRVVLF